MSVFAPVNRSFTRKPVALAYPRAFTESFDDSEIPECPSCGGELGMWPTSIDDHTQLTGRCLECDRCALVLDREEGCGRIAMAMPSRPEALAEALAFFRGE
jgi:hypothetical protein